MSTEFSAILLAVEQKHIGPSNPPMHAAGVDPAYIPGLIPPRPAGADGGTDGERPPEDGAARTAVPEDAVPEDAVPEVAATEGEPDGTPEGTEPEDDGKPVFEVSDRRGAIVADRAGVTFRLDTEEAEFGWDEIKAVEIDMPRFGRRFGVTVYTSGQRWFQNDVEASSKTELKTWSDELDAVLDARFEDSEA
ncbi:hypothetical protein [Streptomyces jumonjinensis]|uniref:hypothetical protein n=1 Tax=Streptomyces jumonjinensis TaxID=1945 RepID=UPI00379C86E0